LRPPRRLRRFASARLDLVDVGGTMPDPARHHATFLEDLGHHAANQVHGDAKPIPSTPRFLGEHRRVDADELAFGVDQRATELPTLMGRPSG
jgi:hypothetical protein